MRVGGQPFDADRATVHARFRLWVAVPVLLLILPLRNVGAYSWVWDPNGDYLVESTPETLCPKVMPILPIVYAPDTFVYTGTKLSTVYDSRAYCTFLRTDGNNGNVREGQTIIDRDCHETESLDPERKGVCLAVKYHLIAGSVVDNECEGNPCHPATGNKSQQQVDVSGGPGGLTFARYYNSLGDQISSGALAPGWRHSFDRHLNEKVPPSPGYAQLAGVQSGPYDTPSDACLNGWNAIKSDVWNGVLSTGTATVQSDRVCAIRLAGKSVASFSIRSDFTAHLPAAPPPPSGTDAVITLSRPDGSVLHFENDNGAWTEPFVYGVSLIETAMGWLFTDEDNAREQYDSAGRLLSITDARGGVQTMTYDDIGRLVRVDAGTGEFLMLGYDLENRITSVTDSANRTWTYRYSANRNLEYVDNPDATTRQYHYEDLATGFALTGITDERGIRYATWAYSADGKAILSEHSGGVERVGLIHNADGTTTVYGSRGTSRTYHFAPQRGSQSVTLITGDLCVTCPNGDKKQRTYDNDGNLASVTDWSDKVTKYGNYDTQGQKGCVTEGIDASDSSTGACAFDPAVSPDARRTDYTYDSRFHGKVTTMTESSVY